MCWQQPRTLGELSDVQRDALGLDAALVRVARGSCAIELAIGRTLDRLFRGDRLLQLCYSCEADYAREKARDPAAHDVPLAPARARARGPAAARARGGLTHHLHGIHLGYPEVTGRAGERLHWRFGPGDAVPLEEWITCGDDDVRRANAATGPGGPSVVTEGRDAGWIVTCA